MATSSGSITRRGLAFALVAESALSVGAVPALAGDFTQQECKGIGGIAVAIVQRVGKDNLSMEFRQSFRNWLGAEMRCDGPKEIVIVTDRDSATFGTIRSELLQLPRPISLEKAGLRGVAKPGGA